MGQVAGLLTLKANWFDTLTVKQWEIMINNDVLLLFATNEETPYEHLLHKWKLLRAPKLIQTPILIPVELKSQGEKYSFRSNWLQNTLR